MTDTDTQTATGKKPSLIAYHVRDNTNGEGFFTRIGAAWPNKKGNGFNIQLDVIPLNGRISLCPPSEKKG
jgi:hypothetical protein